MKIKYINVTNTLPLCPLRVWHYMTKGPKPPNAKAHIGTCFHNSMAINFVNKAVTGKDEKLDTLKNAFVQSFRNPEQEVIWEDPKSKEEASGLAVVEHYYENFCPDLVPFSEEAVEVPLKIDMGGFFVVGHPDLVTKGRRVVDHKSVVSKRSFSKWTPVEAAGKPQSFGYPLAGQSGLFGEKKLFEIDYNIVAPTGEVRQVSAIKDKDQIGRWLKNVRNLHAMLEAEKPIANTQGWWCLSMDTQIATQRGWLFVHELKLSDWVLTLSPLTGCCEWEHPSRIFVKDWGKPMVRYESKSADFCVTPDHPMFMRTKGRDKWSPWQTRQAGTMINKEAILKCSGKNPFRAGVEIKPFGEVNENLCELAGWMAAEGHFRNKRKDRPGRSWIIEIAQAPETSGFARIKELLEKEKISFSISDQGVVKSFRVKTEDAKRLRKIQPSKQLPQWLFWASEKQARAWIKGFVAGDGSLRKNGFEVTQKDERFIDRLQILCVENGFRATKSKELLSSTGGRYFSLSASRRSKVNIGTSNKIELGPPEKEVWDITIPNHLFLVRRNGRAHFTHNCSEKWCGYWFECEFGDRQVSYII